MTAYGYIRKSVVHDPSRMLSPEMQEAAIRRLAAADGHADIVLLSDLDVSGRKGRDRRPGWDELLRAVEDGDATAVYAYSLSRFARSVAQLADFFELCERRKVRIKVDRDQIDTSTATGRLVGNVLASLAQFEADVASERVRDAFAAKRLKDPTWEGPGNREYGAEDGEDAQAVVAAFRDAGSFDGAARLLNERGVPTRLAAAVWHGSTVAAIVRRLAPDSVQPSGGRGSKGGRRDFKLARLLVCGQCGTRMTGSTDSRTGLVRYYCHRAKVVPHPRSWISEPVILAAVGEEAWHLGVRIRRRQKGSKEDEARLAALAQKRDRVLVNFEDGLIDRGERDRRLAAVAEEQSRLSTVRWVNSITIPPDTVKGEAPDVNAHLRRLFERIVIDMSEPARPGPARSVPRLEYVWRDPTLREDWPEDAIAG